MPRPRTPRPRKEAAQVMHEDVKSHASALKSREIPTRFRGNPRVEVGPGRFSVFFWFSWAPHRQISGKIEKSAGSKLHSAFWANIHEIDEWRLDPDDLPIFGDFRRLPIGKFPEKSGKSTGYHFKSACWKHVETCCQHVENNVENMLKICWKRVEKC